MSALKTFGKVTLSIVVIMALLAGAGLAYTYFLGPDGTQTDNAVQEPVQPRPQTLAKPAPQDPNARVGVSVSSLLSPVAPGSNTSLSVRTNQLAKCKIVVTYGGVAAKDSGLVDHTADEFGTATWTWTVPAGTPEGAYPVRVECANAGGSKSAVVQTELVVSSKADATP